MSEKLPPPPMATAELPWEDPWLETDQVGVLSDRKASWERGANMTAGILKLGQMGILNGRQIAYLSECLEAENTDEPNIEIPAKPWIERPDIERMIELGILQASGHLLVQPAESWDWQSIKESGKGERA